MICVRVFYGAANASASNPWGDGPEGFLSYNIPTDDEKEAYRKARQWFTEDNPEYKNFVRYMEIF